MIFSMLELTKASKKSNKTFVGKQYTIVNVRNDGTYSANYQLILLIMQPLYLHSECYCSGWSGDIHCNIHMRMFQGNCGTSVSILRSLWSTRWYLKNKPQTKKFDVLSLVQRKGINSHTKKNDWYSYTENDKITSNQQKYADRSVVVKMFWWCRKSLQWVSATKHFYMLPRYYQGKGGNPPYRPSNQSISNSCADITRPILEQPNRLSRNYLRRNGRDVILYVMISFHSRNIFFCTLSWAFICFVLVCSFACRCLRNSNMK